MKRIIFTIIVFASLLNLQAQQLNNFSQVLENKYVINPAAMGMNDDRPLFLGYKQMWTGIDDAPSFQYLTYQMRLERNLGAIGGKIFNYKTGPISKSGLNLSYAYQFKLNDDLTLSLGLDASMYQFYLNKSSFKNLEHTNDAAIMYSSDKLIVPDANFGAYMFGKNYFVGISSMQLFGRKVKLMNESLFNNQGRHYFFHGGYAFDLNSDFTLEPSALVKFVESGFGQWDINVKATYKKLVWFGLGYRSDFDFAPNDVVVFLGARQERVKIGYAFEYTLSDIGANSQGTHEIFLMYIFGKDYKSRTYRW